MTHTESICTFQYTKAPDGFGGFDEGVEPKDDAPKWATVQETDGGDTVINTRNATESFYDVTVNYPLNCFKYKRTMNIITRFGVLDIVNIVEEKRKRTIQLTCVRVQDTNDVTGEGGQASGGIYTEYQPATPGGTSITIDKLINNEVLLVFRDGICKWRVNGTPTHPNQMLYIQSEGRFELMEGDIFGDELITVLYKVN